MIAFLAAGIALIAAYTLILLVEDAIPAWHRRLQRNRAIRQLRQRDELAARRHRAARRMVSGGRSL